MIPDEEKRRIIFNLKSSVPTIRYYTLKKLSEMADTKPEIFSFLAYNDEMTLEEIITSIKFLKEYDRDEIIRREASIALEKIQSIVGPKFGYEVLYCHKCKKYLDITWNYCPNCGEDIPNKNNFRTCPKCNSPIKSNWNFCAVCGNKLKISEEVLLCPNCKRKIDTSWIICPYCGYRLKSV